MAKKPAKNGDPNAIPGIDIISGIEVSQGGRAMFLQEALNTVIAEACNATERYGKKSELKLTIKVDKLEHNRVSISAILDAKIAKGLTTPIKVHTNAKGELFLEDPLQPTLSGMESIEEFSN